MARVVFVNVGFPHQLDYPEARPLKLALEAGHEVHAVSLEQDHPGFPDVRHWREPSMARMVLRARGLKGDVAFFERPGRLLVGAALVPRSWVRAPERVESRAKRALQSVLIRRVQAVTFTNPHERTLWPVAARRVRELPYPVDLAFWEASQPRRKAFWTSRSLPVPTTVIACLANLMARKQQPELVRWAAPLLRGTPGLVLCFAGREYEAGTVAAIASAAEQEGVAAQVHVLGFLDRDAARALLAWTDLHVVNSRNETQCMALYEGLAAGVATMLYDYPVLTSAFPRLPRHRDSESFCANARRLLDEPGAGARQRAEARARLDWAGMPAHDALFAEGLDELVGGGRG